MTANSIAYAKQQEEARHNAVVERLAERERDEVERHNKQSEQISIRTVQENERHNRTTETQSQTSINENVRHNVAYETEQNRHNTILEDIDVMKNEETKRHNLEMEKLERSSQDIGWFSAYSGRISAGAAVSGANAQMISAGAASTNATTNRLQYQLSKDTAEGNTAYGFANISNIHAKTVTEQESARVQQSKVYLQNSQTANNILSPFTNIIGGILKIKAGQ